VQEIKRIVRVQGAELELQNKNAVRLEEEFCTQEKRRDRKITLV
jgi:hypothetical protein